MNLQEDRFCRSESDSDSPILFVADIPFFRCPNNISSEVKYLFAKIVAVQQGFIQPPEATIFWLSAVREIGSAMSLAMKEAKKRSERKFKSG